MLVKDEYKIKDNESDEHFQYRISALKEANRWTWQEVADIINSQTGNEYTESKYRRDWKLISAAKNEIESNNICSSEYEEPKYESKNLYVEKEQIESEQYERDDYILTSEDEDLKEKYQMSTDRLPYLRLMRQNSRFEKFYRMIAQNINKYTPPRFIADDYSFENNENEKEYVLSLADLHIGANFECVNNHYSIAEARRRFELAFSKIAAFVQKNKIKKLHIVSLGDIVQGILRISDLKLNEAPVVDAFIVACRLVSKFLNDLSAYCYIDFHQVCFSNHDQIRPLGTKASELASEDLGKIFFNYLTDVLADNARIRILGDPDNDYIEFDIFDFKCIALHGHQISNINTVIKDLSNRNRTFYDYAFLGHTHSAKEIIVGEGAYHNIEVLISSSFCGSDPYADKLMVGSKASVKIFEFDELYGHVASYNIILN